MNSTPLDRVRWKNKKLVRHTGQIVALLKMMGVPKRLLYVQRLSDNGSFWLRKINHMEVLERARELYRQQIVYVHPDKAGGCLERTIQLNGTWDKIEQRFKKHGHELW